ncbi:fungal hydrophobin-domain-containing protein [Flammula alnicola]|nr:fungal hydrophobin-domain-containing protein [Flammula alnicola]
MFSRVFTAFVYVFLTMTILAAAKPWDTTYVISSPYPPATTTVASGPSNQCNTGSLQCCNSVQSASSSAVTTLLGLLGVVLSGVTGLVGITCSPITAIGASGTSCSEQPVCCENNSFNGIIAIGCTPININL